MWDNITFTAVLMMLAFVTVTIAPATVSGALAPSVPTVKTSATGVSAVTATSSTMI